MSNLLLVKRTETGTYLVKNIITDESIEMHHSIYNFLKNLDGDTEPKQAAQERESEAECLLADFKERQFVRTDRKIKLHTGVYLRTLFIPKRKKSNSAIPKIFNILLMLGWCPVLIYGIRCLIWNIHVINSDYYLLGEIIALVLGILLHETAHAMACLAYGGRFFEGGLAWFFMVPGGYVLIDTDDINSILKRVQISLAGVEMNLMLAGIFFILSTVTGAFSGCFFYGAITNILLAVSNMTFIMGFDGCDALCEILGIRKKAFGIAEIWTLLLFEDERRNVYEDGKVVLVAGGILLVYQVLIVFMIIESLWFLVGGFL